MAVKGCDEVWRAEEYWLFEEGGHVGLKADFERVDKCGVFQEMVFVFLDMEEKGEA